MTQAQGIELARHFAQSEFVDRGMIADLNVHWDMGKDGMPRPHAHVMLTTRAVDENGFGPKVRDWNRTEMVERWRERWAELATNGSPNSTSTRASTIAASRRRALRWSRKPRLVHPPNVLKIGVSRAKGSRPPTAPRCIAR